MWSTRTETSCSWPSSFWREPTESSKQSFNWIKQNGKPHTGNWCGKQLHATNQLRISKVLFQITNSNHGTLIRRSRRTKYREVGGGAGEIGALTEPIIGVEAAREPADGVEHIETERAPELRRQAQQEASDATEVGPHRSGRRRGGANYQPAPEHRCQRRELLRRRGAPYDAVTPSPAPRGLPVALVVLVPRHARRGHRGDDGLALVGWFVRVSFAGCGLVFVTPNHGMRERAKERSIFGAAWNRRAGAFFCLFLFSGGLGVGGRSPRTNWSRQLNDRPRNGMRVWLSIMCSSSDE